MMTLEYQRSTKVSPVAGFSDEFRILRGSERGRRCHRPVERLKNGLQFALRLAFLPDDAAVLQFVLNGVGCTSVCGAAMRYLEAEVLDGICLEGRARDTSSRPRDQER